MISMGMILLFALLFFGGMIFVIHMATKDPKPPKKDTRTLRQVEKILMDIRTFSTDMYATGKAEEALSRIDKSLER